MVGYRVYELSVGRRLGWRNHDNLGDLVGVYPRRAFDLLKELEGHVLKYTPDLQEPRDPVPDPLTERGAPVLVIDSVTKVGSVVSCEVLSGHFGDHDALLGQDVEPITDRAAGRKFRIDLYFPKAGETGLAVAETRGRTTPVPLVLRWLARQDALRLRDDSSESDYWRTVRLKQKADRMYLHNLVTSARSVTVNLVQAGAVSSRGRPKDVSHALALRDLDDSQQDEVAQQILRWMEGDTDGAVRKIMRGMGLERKKLADASLSFNNTTVSIDGDVQTVSVTPANVKDLFTYPLTREERPGPTQWRTATGAKVSELAQIDGVELDL